MERHKKCQYVHGGGGCVEDVTVFPSSADPDKPHTEINHVQ